MHAHKTLTKKIHKKYSAWRIVLTNEDSVRGVVDAKNVYGGSLQARH